MHEKTELTGVVVLQTRGERLVKLEWHGERCAGCLASIAGRDVKFHELEYPPHDDSPLTVFEFFLCLRCDDTFCNSSRKWRLKLESAIQAAFTRAPRQGAK